MGISTPTPIKITTKDVNLTLDINYMYMNVPGWGSSTNMFILDQSSYMWGWGDSNRQQLTAIVPRQTWSYSPLFLQGDRQYSKLVKRFSAALDASSYAWTWGSNDYGVLGIVVKGGDDGVNPGGDYGVPQSVVGGKQWRTLVGGWGDSSSQLPGYFLCGLDASSYAWAWGCNTSGTLGNNVAGQHRSSPTSVVGGKQWITIDAGAFHVCALDASSYAWSWGDNTYGQGSIAVSPSSVAGGKQFKNIYAGENSIHALDASSYAWAWGANNYMQLGDGTGVMRPLPKSVTGGPWEKLFVCDNTVIGKTKDAYFVWGQGVSYATSPFQFTMTRIAFPTTPQKILGGFSGGGVVSGIIILDTSSNTWVWNSLTTSPTKVIRKPNYSASFVPTTAPATCIKLLPFATSLGDGTDNHVYLDISSYAWAWGSSTGDGTADVKNSPVSVVGGIRWLTLSAAITSVLGLNLSSYAWTWGSPITSGDGTANTRLSPVSVIGGKQWRKILTGGYGGIGIDASSYVWTWGDNSYGQLGNNNQYDTQYSPVSVVGGRRAIDIGIVTDGGYSCALIDASSFIWCWGSNSYGQLGNNDAYIDQSSPVSVVGGRRFLKVVGGSNGGIGIFHALDASSYGWSLGGMGSGYALGNNDGGAVDQSSPVSIGRQFTSISYRCGIDGSSYAWCWGQQNSVGQVGDGGASGDAASPVSVMGGYQYKEINLGLGVPTYPTSIFYAWGQLSMTLSNFDITGFNYYGVLGGGYPASSFPIVGKLTYKIPNISYYNIPFKTTNILGK